MGGHSFTRLAAVMCAIACNSPPAGHGPPEPAAAVPAPVPNTPPPKASTPKATPSPTPDPLADRIAAGHCLDGEICHSAAVAEERAQHPEAAASLYERACGLGNGRSCHRLGELYLDGKGVTADESRARALFEQGCRQDSTAACDALGH